MRSLLATTYQAGLRCHAATDGFAAKIDPAVHSCFVISCVFSEALKSCAKSSSCTSTTFLLAAPDDSAPSLLLRANARRRDIPP
jgi:hypothetical protein